MKKSVWLFTCLVSIQLSAQNVGIGTNFPSQKLDVAGNVFIRDSLGIGISTPHAPLQFSNTLGKRKIVLYDAFNTDNQYYGFGVTPGQLRYQTDQVASDHAFYSGYSGDSSVELMRIKGNGSVGIGIGIPTAKLDVNGSGKFRGDVNITNNDIGGTWLYLTNTSSTATGWKIISTGIASPGGAGHLYFYDSANNNKITILKNGNMGIGNPNPPDKLNVNGNLQVSGTLKAGYIMQSNTAVLTANHNGVVQCGCPAGTVLVGGGGGNIDIFDPQLRNVTISYSGPDLEPGFSSTLWSVYMSNPLAYSVNIRAYAICARIAN